MNGMRVKWFGTVKHIYHYTDSGLLLSKVDLVPHW